MLRYRFLKIILTILALTISLQISKIHFSQATEVSPNTPVEVHCNLLLAPAKTPFFLGRDTKRLHEFQNIQFQFPDLVELSWPGYEQLKSEFNKNNNYYNLSDVQRIKSYLDANATFGNKNYILLKLKEPKYSSVCLASPTYPTSKDLETMSRRDYTQWVRKNGLRTFKAIMFSHPVHAFHPTTSLYIMERTLKALGYLNQMSAHIKFENKTLFRVAPLLMKPETIYTAVFEQEYVWGPTAYELYQAILSEYIIDIDGHSITSEKFLAKYKMSRDSAKKLLNRLDALTQFYVQINSWAKQVPILKLLGSITNTDENLNPVPVHFDLNHGKNIVYDPIKDEFVIIDG